MWKGLAMFVSSEAVKYWWPETRREIQWILPDKDTGSGVKTKKNQSKSKNKMMQFARTRTYMQANKTTFQILRLIRLWL